MSGDRLATLVEVSALLRKVTADGGFGAVLRQGDENRGSLILVITSRGRHFACLQRQLDLSSGNYVWNRVGPPESTGSAEIRDFLAAQARFDPDLWQIELDVASPERFIAETSALG